MNTYTIIGCLISIVFIIFLLLIRPRIVNPLVRSFFRGVFLFFFIYLSIQIAVYIRWEFFLPLETNDTARNFSFIIGGVYAAILSFCIGIFDLIITYLKIKKTNNQ